jgi:cell division protein FtsX
VVVVIGAMQVVVVGMRSNVYSFHRSLDVMTSEGARAEWIEGKLVVEGVCFSIVVREFAASVAWCG